MNATMNMLFDENFVNTAYLVLAIATAVYHVIRDYLDRKMAVEARTESNNAMHTKIPPDVPYYFLALEWEKISREVWIQQGQRHRATVGACCLSVFRVTQDGKTVHLLTEGAGTMDMFHAAMRLWVYLLNKSSPIEPFAQTPSFACRITPEMFQDYANEMQQNTGRVITALDIDLDRGTFSTMAGADGWQTYTIRDACMIACHIDNESDHG